MSTWGAALLASVCSQPRDPFDEITTLVCCDIIPAGKMEISEGHQGARLAVPSRNRPGDLGKTPGVLQFAVTAGGPGTPPLPNTPPPSNQLASMADTGMHAATSKTYKPAPSGCWLFCFCF